MHTDPRGDGQAEETGVEIPFRELSPDALRGLIESFVGREGTDYGEVERSLEEKVADVQRQLERGEARVLFDAESESVNIVLRDEKARRGADPAAE